MKRSSPSGSKGSSKDKRASLSPRASPAKLESFFQRTKTSIDSDKPVLEIIDGSDDEDLEILSFSRPTKRLKVDEVVIDDAVEINPSKSNHDDFFSPATFTSSVFDILKPKKRTAVILCLDDA